MSNVKGATVVTGAAGFIGSNLVKALNTRGCENIIAVDDLTDGHKFTNLAVCALADYIHYEDFLRQLQNGELKNINTIFHQGACSDTTEWNGRYMMDVNYEFSKQLLRHCTANNIALIYASSAAVYGASETFVEQPDCEVPLNVYGYSKILFDQLVRREVLSASESPNTSQVCGLRYFNVYGPREQHKAGMASVAWHLHQQLQHGDRVKLFEGSGGYANGEQQRDFVYVDDVVAVNLWLFDNPGVSGIFNVGTGRSQSFNDVAEAVIKHHQRGSIEYIEFPAHLKDAYQSYTKADISALRAAGYSAEFKTVEQGVAAYLAAIS